MKPTPPPPDGPGGRRPAADHPPARGLDQAVHHGHAAGAHDDLHNEDVAHEQSDINVRAVLMSAAILVVVGLVSHVVIYFLFGWLQADAASKDPVGSPLAVPATVMPSTTMESPVFAAGASGPQLLTNEPMALEIHQREMRERLQGYGWVDQATGVARIPIDEAMRLVAERGLPVREGAGAPTFYARPPVRGEGSGGRAITVPLPEPAPEAAAPGGHGAAPHGSTPSGNTQGTAPAPGH